MSDNTRIDRFGATLDVPSELTVPTKHCCVAIMSYISFVSVAIILVILICTIIALQFMLVP
jgi:hypothetical protein